MQYSENCSRRLKGKKANAGLVDDTYQPRRRP
jgi:hypothetical protein